MKYYPTLNNILELSKIPEELQLDFIIDALTV